jgi:two-component system cell cycle sensor histidine kinase/response regulator CckA
MPNYSAFVLIAALALIVGLPEGSEFALGMVALFRASNRQEPREDVVTGFALLENAPQPYLVTDDLGVIRAANKAAEKIASALTVSCAKGAHIRGFFSADPQAEQKIYQAVRAASEQNAGTAEFSIKGHNLRLRADVSSAGAANTMLWAVEQIDSFPEDSSSGMDDFNLDTAPIGFFSADRGGKVTSLNDTLAQWIDKTWPLPEGAEPLTLSELFTDGARRLSPALAKVGETITETATLRTSGEGGRQVQVIQSLTETADGEATTRSFIFPSPPKSEVQVGAASGSRLVRFLDDAPVAVALTSTDGTILEANDMLVERSGGAARVGAKVSIAVRTEDRSEVMERIAEVVKGEEAPLPLEVKLAGENGDEHEARFHVHTISTDRGELLLNYLIDVTEMKQIEHQLAQVQKMHAVGQLAGGIAHDVNNVLTAIRGHCDLLMLRHHEGDPDFEYLNQIRSQTERAAEVISQLLAYSRRQTMRREITQLTDTLDDMKFMLSHLTTERVEFQVQHARDLGLVRIDRSEFQRVIMNLAVNAGHAMPEGGKLVMRTSNVESNDPIIDNYDVMNPGNYVQIEVTDTGSGIEPEHLQKIFEPFFTTKGQGQGTGLGLSSVYGIIKQMNGFIFCVSEIGVGTTFRIFLPRFEGKIPNEEPVVAKKAPTTKPRDLTGSGCILLVEDEDAVRSFAVRALELRGYKVLAAAGGEEALEIVMEDPDAIDLIVSDVIMPGMTGPEMMRKVREVRQDVLFIFISGYAEDAFREEMLEDENFRFLPKPFSLNDLAVKVKEAFEE